MSERPWTRFDQYKLPCMFCGKQTRGRINGVLACCRKCSGSPFAK